MGVREAIGSLCEEAILFYVQIYLIPFYNNHETVIISSRQTLSSFFCSKVEVREYPVVWTCWCVSIDGLFGL